MEGLSVMRIVLHELLKKDFHGRLFLLHIVILILILFLLPV